MRPNNPALLTALFTLSFACVAPAAEPAKLAEPTNSATPLIVRGDPPADGLHSGGPKGWGRYRITDIKANPALPRVLIVGDSVANGYHEQVARNLKGKANVDLYITGRYIAAPDYKEDLAKSLTYGTYVVIHFNESGLHAWNPGRMPEGQYGTYFSDVIGVLRAGAPKSRLIWASNTPVGIKGKPGERDTAIDKTIVEFNTAARAVAVTEGMAIDDLHALMDDKLDLGNGDGFHWSPKGKAVQAEAVTASILAELEKTQTAPATP